tara:strand:+ start:1088 stop:1483 length:396 start_codon:yes stop_codon:yes gene_type:complete
MLDYTQLTKGENTMKNKLPKDFIVSDEYCVIEQGLSKFNKDQIISHKDLLSYLKNNDISSIKVLPHMSDDDKSFKDYEKLNDNIRDILDKAEDKVSDLIQDYNDKYEDNYIDTYDMSSLFDQLKDYIDDHQ